MEERRVAGVRVSTAVDADTPDPTAALRRSLGETDVGLATGVSCSPPQRRGFSGGYANSGVAGGRERRGRRAQDSFTWLLRTKQNLSFVISPLSKTIVEFDSG